MSVSSKADAMRAQLNLKNLQRHDSSILEIIATASYVTVYRNQGDGWIKTGIEGPMFLFSRSRFPEHGFFVLNRQGLEYVQEFLTSDSDVKIEGEFILYEPGEEADRATGLWIAEEKDRSELCRRMMEICNRARHAASTQVAPQQPAIRQQKQPISLDMLFGAAAAANGGARQAAPPLGTSPRPAPASTNVPTLDMLFSSAASPPQPAAPRPPGPSAPTGMSLLDEMFKSAQHQPSPKPAAAAAPAPASTGVPSPQVVASATPNDARALLAMLGHPVSPPAHPVNQTAAAGASVSSAQAPARPPPAAVATHNPTSPVATSSSAVPDRAAAQSKSIQGAATAKFAPPLLSHDVFDLLPPPPGSKPKAASPAPSSRRPADEQKKEADSTAPVKQAGSSSSSSSRHAKQSAANSTTSAVNGVAQQAQHASTQSQTPDTNALVEGHAGAEQPFDKSTVLTALDDALTERRTGMDRVDQGVTLGQKEFVRRVEELLQKPAFATSLYAKYLERCEED